MALSKLKDRDREIISLYYGLNIEKCSQKDIALKYNMSVNYISRIINVGIEKVKKYLANPELMEVKKDKKQKVLKQIEVETKHEVRKKFNYKEGNNELLYAYLVNGDENAYDKLVEKNMNLVYSLSKRYLKEGKNLDEIVSVASVSLLKAIRTFDVNKIGKIAFATYASRVIRNDIFMEYRKEKKYDNLVYFGDPVLGEDEDLTLADTLASEDNFVDDLVEEQSYNEKKIKILEALKTLDQKDRLIVEYLYGFNGGKKYTQNEISKILGLSQSYIARRAAFALKSLSINLGEYKQEYTIAAIKNDMALKMSQVFYSLFKTIDKKDVLHTLSKIKDKELVYLYYGLDGETCLDYDEIANKLNIDTEEVIDKIEKTLAKLRKIHGIEKKQKNTRYNYYKKIIDKYGANKLEEALLKLEERHKNIFFDYYFRSLEKSKVCSKYDINDEDFSKELRRIYLMIVSVIQGDKQNTKERKFSKVKKRNDYDMLVSKYGKEIILQLLEEFNEEKRELFKDYYGIDKAPLTRKELIDKYNVASNTIYQRLNSLVKKMEQLLENPNTYISRKKQFEEMFNGYDLKEVYKLVEKLQDVEKDYLKSFYQLGDDYLTKEEYFNKYGDSSIKSPSPRYLVVKLRAVLDNSNLGINKTDTFYKLFSMYTKTQVNSAIKLLKDKDKNFIKDFYGIDRDIMSTKELAIKYKISRQGCYSKKNNIVKKISAILCENESSKQENFYHLFNEFSETKVNEALSTLNNEDQEIINLIYGLKGVREKREQIAKRFNISKSAVNFRKDKGIEKMKKYLLNPNFEIEEKRNEFYSNFQGFSKEQVDSVISALDDKSIKILFLYYGLNNEIMTQKEIAEICNISRSYLSVKLNKTIKSIKELLDNPSLMENEKKWKKHQSKLKEERIHKYNSIIEKYGKEKLNNEINRLNEKDINIIRDYYGIDCEQLSIKEIAIKNNKNKSYVSTRVKKIIAIIENRLDNPEKFESSKMKFYKKFDGHSEEKVRKVLATFNKKEQDMISLYYGLDGVEEKVSVIAEKYGYKYNSEVANFIKRRVNKISELLSYPDGLFYSLFEGYSKEEVDNILNTLNDKHNLILKDYYGIDTTKLTAVEIAKKYNLSNYTYVHSCVRRSIQEIKNRLENHKENKRASKFYSKFKDYSKEEIDIAMDKLNDRHKKIVTLAFGLTDAPLTYKQIALKLNISETMVNNAISTSIKKLDDILSEMDEKKSRIELLIDNYDKELVNICIEKLSDSKRAFLVSYYTLINKKNYSLNKVSEVLKINENDLVVIEDKIINELEQYLKDEYKMAKIVEMQKEFQSKIIDKNKLKHLRDILTESETKLIGIYYGLNGKDIMSIEELSEKFKVDAKKISIMIKNIIYKINTYKIIERQ